MAAQGFEAWWPQREAGGARLCRGAAPLPRDRRASARQLGDRLLRERPDAVHRRRCARLQSRPRGAPARPAASDRALRQPVDLGLAAAAACTRSARGRPRAVPVSVRACAATRRTASRRPTSAIRWPMRSRWRCRAPQRRAALGLAERRRGGRAAARAADAPRSNTSRRACSRAAVLMQRARPGLRFVLPVVPGLRALIEPLLARAPRAGAPIALRRRPLPRGAGGLRRGAGRQRHGDARGGAVQAPDGDRLQHDWL